MRRTKTSVAGERPKLNRCCGTASISSRTGWTLNTVPAAAVPVHYGGTGGTTCLPRNRATTVTTIKQKVATKRRRRRRRKTADVTKITRTIITVAAITRND